MCLLKRKSLLTIFATIIMVIGMLFATIPVKTAHAASSSESESNNTAATANTISVNTSVSANLSSSSDVDWFKFTVLNDGYFYVEFNHTLVNDSDTLWRIYLYDDTGINFIDNNETYFGVTGKDNRKTNTFGVDSGTYLLKITKGQYSSDYSNASYSINVVYESSDSWETELNNSASTADLLTVNETKNASLSTNGDVDWFKFSVNSNGKLYIDFQHKLVDDSDTLWRIYLFDSSAVTPIDKVETSFGVSGKENRQTSIFGIAEGTYYIKVTKGQYSSDYSGVAYAINAVFESVDDWETEINNTSEKADNISVNSPINATISTSGDVDWFKFSLNSSAEISVTLKHEVINDSDALWKIYLYDSSAVTELTSLGRKGNTESGSTEFISVSSGTYYIKITKGQYSSDWSRVPYSLTVTEKHDHRGEWIQTVEPTCTEGGSESRECIICGLVETRDLEALGHKYNSGEQIEETTIVKKGKIEYTCEQCGDQYTEDDKSKVWILPVICVGGILVIIGLINYIRMMKKKN